MVGHGNAFHAVLHGFVHQAADAGLDLLDTPGILWPKFEDQEVGRRLAYTGAIKDDIMDVEELGCTLMEELSARYPQALAERYKLTPEPDTPGWALLEAAGRKRGFLISGGEALYIIETGFSSVGNLAQNFIGLATYTDPQRTTSFPQNWTIFYWAYWMTWCVAAPFFIGSISRGRTVRQTILGGYVFGLGGTFLSFIILGNYSLGLQVSGRLDVMGLYAASGDLYTTITAIVRTLPLAPLVLILLAVTMVAFYATSFDAIALVASAYSYRELTQDEDPHMAVKVFWSLMLILLPMALVFSDNSMANLQTVAIIAAFPISFILLLIIAAFLKDAKRYL